MNIKSLLNEYSDQILIDILIDIIEYDIKIDYKDLSIKIYSSNHHLYFKNIKIIDQMITKELNYKWIKILPLLSDRYFYLLLDLIFKLIDGI